MGRYITPVYYLAVPNGEILETSPFPTIQIDGEIRGGDEKWFANDISSPPNLSFPNTMPYTVRRLNLDEPL